MQKRRTTLIVFIWTSIVLLCPAQELNLPLTFGQEKLTIENKSLSLKEHLRQYYLDKEDVNISLTKNIGDLFNSIGDHGHALKYYNLYQNGLSPTDNNRINISFEKAKIHITLGDYQNALLELLQINKYGLNNLDRYNYYLGIVYLFLDRHEDGINNFKNLTYLKNATTLSKLDSIEHSLIKNGNRKPKRARLLSLLIPGLGQAVNNKPKDGANSFILVGGLTYFMLDLSKSLSLPQSIISFGPWIFRYYAGGIKNAQNAAQEKKDKKKNALILELLSFAESKKE